MRSTITATAHDRLAAWCAIGVLAAAAAAGCSKKAHEDQGTDKSATASSTPMREPARPARRGAMGADTMGTGAMGADAMGAGAMGADAMGADAMGADAMGADAMGAPGAADGGAPAEPKLKPLPEVTEANPPAGGAAAATPQEAGNAARTWVVGTAPLAAPKACTRHTEFAIRGMGVALPGGKVFGPNLNGRVRGWATDPAKADDGWSATSPVLASGLVITGDLRGNVRAFAQDKPVVKWSFKAGKRIRFAPAAAGTRLFVGSDDDHLYALDLATGKLLWKYQARGAIATLPATDGQTVYVGDRKGRTYALDAARGTLRWEAQERLRPGSAPVATAQAVYAMTSRSDIVALDPATGKRRWKHWAGYSEVPSLVVTGGKLVFVYGNKRELRALNLQNGKLAWKYLYPKDTVGALYSPLYAGGGRVYLLEGEVSQRNYSLDLAQRCIDFEPQQVWITALALATGKVIFRADLSKLVLEAVKSDPDRSRIRRCGKAGVPSPPGAADEPREGPGQDEHDPRPAILSQFFVSGRAFVIPLIDAYATCQ